jgi:hypothetical protein
MARRKTWREKLAFDSGLPKVVEISGKMSARWGSGTCAIPAPAEVDHLMRQVPRGRLVTINELRAAIAHKHGATIACPITTGIFAWMAAHAAEEAAADGEKKITPYWRTLKTGGELNPKYPGGIAALKRRLEAEGHRVVPAGKSGKRFVVADYESRLFAQGGGRKRQEGADDTSDTGVRHVARAGAGGRRRGVRVAARRRG